MANTTKRSRFDVKTALGQALGLLVVVSLGITNHAYATQPIGRHQISWLPITSSLAGFLAASIEIDPPVPITGEANQPASVKRQNDAPKSAAVDQAAGDTAPRETRHQSAGLRFEATEFKGVVPGVTTRGELIQSWGKPEASNDADDRHEPTWKIEPFDRVVVTLADGLVSTIVIHLDNTVSASDLSRALDLHGSRPTDVLDEDGEAIGRLFPELGASFVYQRESTTDQVTHIVLEKVGPEPFLLRAEATMSRRYGSALDDLGVVLEFNPDSAKAHWLRARILAEMSQYDEASHAARRAAELAPQESEYRLTVADILERQGDYEEAITQTRGVLETDDLEPVVEAKALVQLGRQMALGPSRDFKQAIERHLDAARMAKSLVDAKPDEQSTAALNVLLDAYLGVAMDTAWGNWKGKDEVVGKWLEGARGVAKRISGDDNKLDARFRLARQAVAAHVGLDGRRDAKEWVDELIDVGEQLIAAAEDDERRGRLAWKLGVALYDALQIDQMRRQTNQALEHGKLAAGHLEAGREGRTLSSNEAYILGRLYFRVGSTYAIYREDHRAAVPWFNKAAPLMTRDVPTSALADKGTQGETLVSMGVSFWQVGDKQEAVRLTAEGLEKIKKAVDEGLIEASALTVPYGNLADMHHQLGDEEKAQQYQRLANEQPKSTRR